MTGVAISGKAGAGKDTFASAIIEVLGQLPEPIWATRVGFADAVKEDVFRTTGLTKSDPGGRVELIRYSNEERATDPAVWIKRLSSTLDSLNSYGVLPVIADMRYTNELEWAKSRGIVTVRIDATLMDRGLALYRRGEDVDLSESLHVSETELDTADFDFRFWNPHGDRQAQLRARVYAVAYTVQAAYEEARRDGEPPVVDPTRRQRRRTSTLLGWPRHSPSPFRRRVEFAPESPSSGLRSPILGR
jgi:hypothetical protein